MRELVLGAFEELTPSFVSNAWHTERGDTRDFATLPFWLDMARQLEAGGFDFLFLAEALGYPMRDDGSVPDTVFREAVQFPVHDPLAIVSGLAAVTSRLGFVVTASTTAQNPYLNARTFTTLDHLTGGRVGWNIVTTDTQAALVRLLGHDGITPHDERYRRAAEFLDLSLHLWEGGWDDDALIADKARRVYADPAKVHRVTHAGEYFRLDGYFPAVPSPQRTPTLFQAGTSDAGTDFAARYAECVFTAFQDADRGARTIAGLRAKAERAGRGRDAVRVINGVSVVVADTPEEAAAQRRELDAAPSADAAAVLFLAWSGVDLTDVDPATPTSELSTEVGQTNIAMWADNPETPTVGDVLAALPSRAGGLKVTGTPEQAADALVAMAERADIDGYLIEHTWGGMESYRGFIDDVVPILRDRGALPAQPRGGPLREMLTAADSARLPASHPGAAYRGGAAS